MFGFPRIMLLARFSGRRNILISSWKNSGPTTRKIGRRLPDNEPLHEFPELKHLHKDTKLEKIRINDGVTSDHILIYKAPNGTRLVSTYLAVQSLGLTLLGVCGHYVYVHLQDLISSFADIDVDPLPAAFCTCIFSLVVVLATRGILRRSPLRIYLNPNTNEYTMIKLSMLLRSLRITFTSADVAHTTGSSYFMALYTGSAKIRNCYYYIDPQCFGKPSYYNMMMGKSWEENGSAEKVAPTNQIPRHSR